MAKAGPRVVGLDLSLTATGIAFADGSTATVKDSKIKGTKRLLHLYLSVYEACLLADFVVIEDLPTHAKSAGLTGKAHGVVEMAMEQLQVPFVKITPSTLKKAATGNGTADKSVLKDHYLAQLEEGMLTTGLITNPKDDNQVDAWWLRQIGLQLLGKKHHLSFVDSLDRYETEEVLALREVWR